MKIEEELLSTLIEEGWSKGISYQEYRELVENLAKTEKSTGLLQPEAYINYTLLNHRRMKRWDKTLQFNEETVKKIQSFNRDINWLVLTESWCGDASPALPVMNKISQINSKIAFKIILRDENLELMDQFLTNGSRSIPKLIAIQPETGEVIGTWGSRSKNATKLVEDFKMEHGTLTAEFRESLQIWYNKDRGESIVSDLLQLLSLE